MFQKALHEDLEKNRKEPVSIPAPMTISQKHRITKKKGDPKTAQVLNNKPLQSSSTHMLGTAQYSNRPNDQVIEVGSYPKKEVGCPQREFCHPDQRA